MFDAEFFASEPSADREHFHEGSDEDEANEKNDAFESIREHENPVRKGERMRGGSGVLQIAARGEASPREPQRE